MILYSSSLRNTKLVNIVVFLLLKFIHSINYNCKPPAPALAPTLLLLLSLSLRNLQFLMYAGKTTLKCLVKMLTPLFHQSQSRLPQGYLVFVYQLLGFSKYKWPQVWHLLNYKHEGTPLLIKKKKKEALMYLYCYDITKRNFRCHPKTLQDILICIITCLNKIVITENSLGQILDG